MHKLIGYIFIFFCLPCLLSAASYRYILVTSASQIESGHVYVLVSQANNEHFALTASERGSNKLAGTQISVSGDTLLQPSEALLWTLNTKAKGFSFYNEAKSKYLATKDGSTNLFLDSYATAWTLALNDENITVSVAYDGSVRQIGYDAQSAYFGNYASSQASHYGSLKLYRQTETDDESGEEPQPEQTKYQIPDLTKAYSLTATSGEVIYAASSRQTSDGYLRQADVTQNLLADSSLVIPNRNFHWHFTLRTDSMLNLTDDAGNYYVLSRKSSGLHALTPQSIAPANFRWMLKNGCLYGQENSDAPLALVLNSTGNSTVFALKEEALVTSGQNRVSLRCLAADSSSVRNAQGLVSLQGGWSANQLANVLTAGVLSLDLTKITLPLHAKDFNYTQPTNALIYVLEGMLPYIPNSWNNVIVCSDTTGNRPLRPIKLTDRHPFYAAYAFYTGNDELSYIRSTPTDGKWNTAYLPFAMSAMPAGLEAFSFQTISNATLELETMGAIPAYAPILLRYSGTATTGSKDIEFVAESQLVPATPLPDTERTTRMSGVLQQLSVADSNEPFYFLSNDGTRFVRAANGSYLDPFRCYLFIEGSESTSRSLQIGGIHTAISSATLTDSEPGELFTADGASLGKRSLQQLKNGTTASGIYIWKNRKITVR